MALASPIANHDTPAIENIVVKIGGASLFRPNIDIASMEAAIRPGPTRRVFVLFGGGDTIESMRTLHARFPRLDPVALHWRCIRLLDATWEVACELLPDHSPVADWETLIRSATAHGATSDGAKSYLVRAGAFYSETASEDLPEAWLPRVGWETTTDALSWLLAKVVQAPTLRLAKQCKCNPDWSVHEAHDAGIIDSELARLATADSDPIRIEWFQL
jgi:hypothetical protein